MNPDIEKIKQLGRDHMIRMGLDRVKEHMDANIDINAFDRITVMANTTNIRVEFSNPIKFAPSNSSHFYDITVDIIDEGISYDIFSNPADFESELMDYPFFVMTVEADKHIQFVINALNGEGIKEDRKTFGQDMEGYLLIRDHAGYYQIERNSKYQESWYKIDKVSGEIYDAGHAHLEPYPDEEEKADEFVEIKV